LRLARRRRTGIGLITCAHGIALGLIAFVLAPSPVRAQGADSVVVAWTAPGDDGWVGRATTYDLRVSQSPITAAGFAAATPVNGLPAPLASGTRQQVVVRGLTRGTTYYFAMRTADDAGNWSGVSNVLKWTWTLDSAPPAAPSGVEVEPLQGGARVAWSPNSEPDLGGYRVYRGLASGGPYALLGDKTVTETEFIDTNVPSNPKVWYRVTAVDGTGNESAPSQAVALALDETAVSSATRLELESGYPNPSRSGDPVHIPVTVPLDAPASAVVEVYDGAGRRIRVIDVALTQGTNEVVWDGKNDAGREVAPGVYRACLIAGKTRSTIRLLRQP
jgi:hypothetical protein